MVVAAEISVPVDAFGAENWGFEVAVYFDFDVSEVVLE